MEKISKGEVSDINVYSSDYDERNRYKLMRFFTEPKPRQLGTVYILGLDWLGEGLLIANGQKWLRNRRLLTPAFHFDILQSYIALKNKAASVLVVLILHLCIMLSNLESKAFILILLPNLGQLHHIF